MAISRVIGRRNQKPQTCDPCTELTIAAAENSAAIWVGDSAAIDGGQRGAPSAPTGLLGSSVHREPHQGFRNSGDGRAPIIPDT